MCLGLSKQAINIIALNPMEFIILVTIRLAANSIRPHRYFMGPWDDQSHADGEPSKIGRESDQVDHFIRDGESPISRLMSESK